MKKLSLNDFQNHFQLWVYPYELLRKQAANSLNKTTVQQGTLIKIEDSYGNEGYADLCPWPQFGDSIWEVEIASYSNLFQRALELAYFDLEARKNKIQLLTDIAIINNVLISNYHQFDLRQSSLTKFSTLKIKGDTEIKKLAAFIKAIKNHVHKIRLDFNFCLTENEFKMFLSYLNESDLCSIEYVEDPFPFNETAWLEFNKKIKLALDWGAKEAWPYLKIYKPSRDQVSEKILAQSEFSLTSAMEHPVGLVHGLYWAQKFSEKAHGFLTLDFYEMTDFNYFFEQVGEQLIYRTDGFGIGFTQILRRLNWRPYFFKTEEPSVFVLAPHRTTDRDRQNLFEIKKHWVAKKSDFIQTGNSEKNQFILVPSSGSTQKENESVKVLVHSLATLNSSANRVNEHFQVDSTSKWGCTLPLFHVGGLGTFLRAQAAQAEFFQIEWIDFNVEWIEKNQITHLSLVPPQVFELVQKNQQAPKCLKHVLVGGAALNAIVGEKALKLGWPITQTYGMTETGSMIAVKKVTDHFFKAMKQVTVSANNQRLQIETQSLALAELRLNFQNENHKLEIHSYNATLMSEDIVEFSPTHSDEFKFVQRDSDYVKVKAEGVSLFELREVLSLVLLQKNMTPLAMTLCDFSDERDGSIIAAIVDLNILSGSTVIIKDVLNEFNKQVRPFEKITQWFGLAEIPRTSLGKVRYTEIKQNCEIKNAQKI